VLKITAPKIAFLLTSYFASTVTRKCVRNLPLLKVPEWQKLGGRDKIPLATINHKLLAVMAVLLTNSYNHL